VGHLQVVTRLTDQLYRNVWSVLGGFWGRGAPYYNTNTTGMTHIRGYEDDNWIKQAQESSLVVVTTLNECGEQLNQLTN